MIFKIIFFFLPYTSSRGIYDVLQEELPYDAEVLSPYGVFALFSKAVYATVTDGNTCVLFHGIPSTAKQDRCSCNGTVGFAAVQVFLCGYIAA